MIYNLPNVYKQSVSTEEIRKVVSSATERYKFKVLDKYKNSKWNWQDFESRYCVSYNKALNIIVVSTSIEIYTPFSLVYNDADGCGSPSWPALAYAELDEMPISEIETDWVTIARDNLDLTNISSVVFSTQINSKKLCYRIGNGMTLKNGWLDTSTLTVLV